MVDATTKLTSKVEAAVTTAVEKPSTPAHIDAVPVIMTELQPILQTILNSTNAEPWYQSRVFWGSIVALLATVLGIFGIAFPSELQGTVLTIIMGSLPLVGGLYALYGRFKTNKPLGS